MSLLQSSIANLYASLSRHVATSDDAMNLVIAGETLRRVNPRGPDEVPDATGALCAYEEVLRQHADLIPGDLGSRLRGALSALHRAADDPSMSEATHVLRAVDEILMVAAGAHRVGRLDRGSVDTLARNALAVASELAPSADTLWSEANKRAARIGPDPDMPHLSEWLEQFASFSEARIAALVAARRGGESERRERATSALLAARERDKNGGATANVVVTFQTRSVVPKLTAAAADARPAWDDPSGDAVLSTPAVTVHVREHIVDGGSEVVIRIVAQKGHGIDLSGFDAVVVRDAHDVVRSPLQVDRARLYWCASFAGEGVFDIDVLAARVRARIKVARPDRP